MKTLRLNIPSNSRKAILLLAYQILQYASTFGKNKWGLTYFNSMAIRVNVGWTEILTASQEGLRLIVDYDLVKKAKDKIIIDRGLDRRGYYPSIPGSALIDLSYGQLRQINDLAKRIKPALQRTIELAARRSVGRGVKAGHNQWAVEIIAIELNKQVLSPGYQSSVELKGSQTNTSLLIMEGSLKRVVMSKYERNSALRLACVKYYGAKCIVCGFSFRAKYGPLGEGFIHVHHLDPLSKSGKVAVNPIRDLRPVCPNCHSMIHRKDIPIPIDELRELIRK